MKTVRRQDLDQLVSRNSFTHAKVVLHWQMMIICLLSKKKKKMVPLEITV